MTGGVNDFAPRRTVVHPAVWARICELVDRTPSPFLERVRREAAEQDYPMEETTTFTAEGVVQWGDGEPFERDESLMQDIGSALDGCWLMLLAYLGGRRGVVSPKCYEGLRPHGYVAKVGR